METTDKNGVRYFHNGNVVQSVFPAESHFGFSYWSHLIPPFKPREVLILGYGAGTVGELIRKVWGDTVHITGVDKHVNPKQLPFATNGVTVIERDAKDYLADTNKEFDFVVVDLFEGAYMSPFVKDPIFVSLLMRVAKKMVAINTFGLDESTEKIYKQGFSMLKSINVEGRNEIAYFQAIDSNNDYSDLNWNK